MENVTKPRKIGLMVEEFRKAGHTFASPDVKLKGELQDVMGFGDVIVVDHAGTVIGMARESIDAPSPLTAGSNVDNKYDVYLKFAHRHECVMVVRADSEAAGVCVFSHEALNQGTPECYHIVTVWLLCSLLAHASIST